ncbi:helix-turn-helix transcriptional regulator [Cochlodiniinecator piscidefendens]|uniref:helix-turn-helix transcriptional regulator n=1 Tax=Cochlodiniinecator piscidefendens TaxID=2715756 RepID=UPI00140E1833|nr:YafY family protein [Cochlodiniinecator piscidefendens]
MARSARLFEIIQLLRGASGPMRAVDIAAALEVTQRTVYRDVASLQSMRVPIEGAAGVGYILRPGFDLPPLNFDVEEAEAITVGLSMIARTGDKGLQRAARRAARKIADATPLSETLFSSTWGPEASDRVDLSLVRDAIREEQKLQLQYLDAQNIETTRVIKPVAVVYYSESIVIAGWCELRADFRHFRPDRIVGYDILPDHFRGEGRVLRQRWAQDHAGDL